MFGRPPISYQWRTPERLCPDMLDEWTTKTENKGYFKKNDFFDLQCRFGSYWTEEIVCQTRVIKTVFCWLKPSIKTSPHPRINSKDFKARKQHEKYCLNLQFTDPTIGNVPVSESGNCFPVSRQSQSSWIVITRISWIPIRFNQRKILQKLQQSNQQRCE